MIQPLAIVDPALGASGAHNAGLASLLVHRHPESIQDIVFWGSARSVPDWVAVRVDARIELHALFHTNFFALMKRQGNVAQHWPWIRQLATEYAQALGQIAARWPGQPVRVLHHTLSWEHASALALALRLRGDAFPNLLHLCFLMYSPGVDRFGETVDVARRLRFTQAFRALSELKQVRLYAACSEYANAYRHLLSLRDPLSLHPCFLVEGQHGGFPKQLSATKRSDAQGSRSILYMGVIKKEKGFYRLPALLDSTLEQAHPNDELIIQFVRPQKVDDRAEQAIANLHAIADGDLRVRIHDDFWDDSTLTRQLAESQRLFLDYDVDAYRDKTSGLLWLAAWHRLQVVLPLGTWLEREAIRLGIDWLAGHNAPRTVRPKVPEATFEPTYGAALFDPFLPWVLKQNIPTGSR